MDESQESQILSSLNSTTYATEVADKSLSIKVGDEKQSDFYPRVKIEKWDNDVNFSVGVIKDEGIEETITNIDNKIIWTQGTNEAHFYPVNEDNGFEFEVILHNKPTTNVIELSIQTKELVFYYQPFLTEEEKLSREVDRAEDVEGSYAVYHKSKSGDETALGGKNYGTGKAFHIYRPKIIDADGRWAWGTMSIDVDAERLYITIPQSILDNGTYPLIVDPTFGYGSIGATNQKEQSTAIIFWSRFTGVAGYGVSMSISSNTNAGGYLRGVLYYASTNGAVPFGATPALTGIPYQPTAFVKSDFTGSPVLADEDYLVGIFSQGYTKASTNIQYDTGIAGCGGQDNGVTYNATTVPSTVTWDATNDRKYSVYVTYSPSGQTFGKTDDGTNQSNITEDRIMVSAATPISRGILTSLRCRCWVASLPSFAKAVIYSSTDSKPDALLAVGDEIKITNTSLSEITLPFSNENQITLTANTEYWIGIHVQDPGSANFSFKRDNVSSATKRTTQAYTDGPQTPFGTPTNDAGRLAVYGVYTELGPETITETVTAKINIVKLVFNDTFTEVSGNTELTVHTPEIGTWELLYRDIANEYAYAKSSGDTCRFNYYTTSTGLIYKANTSVGDFMNGYARLTVMTAFTTAATAGYLLLRVIDKENFYALRFNTGGASTRLYKKVDGVWTALTDATTDPAIGNTVTLSIYGTTLSFYYNDILQGTVEDSSISVAGAAGLANGGGAELVVSTEDVTGVGYIDNFVVYSDKVEAGEEVTTYTVSTSALVDVQNTVTNTATTKVSVQKQSEYSVSAKTRIQIPGSATVSALARIQKTTTPTISAIVDIFKSVSESVSSKLRVQKSVITSISSVVDVKKELSGTITASTRIKKEFEKSVSAIVCVKKTTDASVSSLIRISKDLENTITALVDVKKTITNTISSVAHITKEATKTISAVVRVQKQSSASFSSKLRVLKSFDNTIQAFLDVKKTITNGITARLLVKKTSDGSIFAKVSVKKSLSNTVSSIMRVQHAHEATISACLSVIKIVSFQTSAKINILKTSSASFFSRISVEVAPESLPIVSNLLTTKAKNVVIVNVKKATSLIVKNMKRFVVVKEVSYYKNKRKSYITAKVNIIHE